MLLPTYKPGHTIDDVILQGIPKGPATFPLTTTPEQYKTKPTLRTMPNTFSDVASPVYINSFTADNYGSLITTIHPEINTVVELFEMTCRENPSCKLWAYVDKKKTRRGYRFITYKAAKKMIINLGSGLSALIGEMQLGQDSVIALYSYNRYEWSLVDFACQFYSWTTASLYDTLGLESTGHILSLTEAKIVFTVNENIAKLVELISSHSLPVSIIVAMDSILEKHQQLCDSRNIHLTTIPALIKKGKDTPSPVSPQTPESTATITFTSGTSTQPKGVPLTQANIVTALSYAASILPSEIMLHKGKARFYAMLPLTHIMERADVYAALYYATCVYYPSDGTNPRSAMDDLKVVRPHVFVTVPGVLIKIESAVKLRFESEESGLMDGFMNGILSKAIERKMEAYKFQGDTSSNPRHLFYDSVLNQFKKKLGLDHILMLVVGSAALPSSTSLFIKCLLNHIWRINSR